MNKNFICLLCFALLSSCAVRNGAIVTENKEMPWEIQFRYRQGQPMLPLHVLNLNETILAWQMDISRIIPAWNETHIIVVKYKGLSKAKVLEVYKRLKEDDAIEVLGMSQY